MIIPFFLDFFDFHKTPATWLLIALNCFVFFMTIDGQKQAENKIDKLLNDSKFIQADGELYKKYLLRDDVKSSPLLRAMAIRSENSEGNLIRSLAQLSIRDQEYLRILPKDKWIGDQVAIDQARIIASEIRDQQNRHPSQVWGVTKNSTSWRTWLTYQFVHGSEAHLLGNVGFLFFFGIVLELLLGSGTFLLLYILSGFVGAFGFDVLTGFSTAPLIGASGAVSGLMGLFAALYWNRRVRFFYWILPFRGYYGFIFLPAWIIVILWLLSDVAGYISTFEELGGVAYGAHIGGALFGVLVGVIYRKIYSITPIYALNSEHQ